MLYIVIGKRIKDDYGYDTKNPAKEELLADLKNYTQIYLFDSKDTSRENVSSILFRPPHPCNNGLSSKGGLYGLVVEVEVNKSGSYFPDKIVADSRDIFQNWIDSETQRLQKDLKIGKPTINDNFSCWNIPHAYITSILNSWIPSNVKSLNTNLQDTDFTMEQSNCFSCSIM